MGRRRTKESVPATEQGIEEVVIKHRQTKSGGIRTTQKTVPIIVPAKKKPGRSSCSTEDDRNQVDGALAGCSTLLDPQIDDLQVPQYIDEQAAEAVLDDNMVPDKSTKSNVCNQLCFQCCDLISTLEYHGTVA